MQQPLITVIVPVYKAEHYLQRCVDSIIKQTYKNLEIILVNDGSPDKCGQMCDEFAKKDSRIRVFHKENGGQSSARNLGLDNMSGEYVGFVDSDDWIEPNMYEHLYKLLRSNNAQIAVCGTQLDHLDGKITYFNTNYPNENEIKIYTTIEALKESFNNQRITYSPCDKLYASEIFSSLRMTVGRIYEDMEIIPKCIERAERVVYDPIALYHYNLTAESTLRGQFNQKKFAEADVALEKAIDYEVRYPQLWGHAMASYIEICLQIVHSSSGVKSCAERRGQIICWLRGELPLEAVKLLNRNTKIKLKTLRISPVAYEFLMCIYEFMTKNRK